MVCFLLDEEKGEISTLIMLRLQCKVQHYEWGRIGADSEVARLHALSSGEGFQDLPYAELWMGTHPSGPSSVILEGGAAAGGDSNPVLLQQWLDMHPESLGKKVQQRWDGELPFLFKVKIERETCFSPPLSFEEIFLPLLKKWQFMILRFLHPFLEPPNVLQDCHFFSFKFFLSSVPFSNDCATSL